MQDFLLHAFWSGQLAALGTTPTVHERMIDNLSNKLGKRAYPITHFNIADPYKRRELAEWALREASQERRALRHVQFDELLRAHDELRRLYSERHPPPEGADAVEEERRWREDLIESLEYLCRRQVMHQGYEWSCRHCLHKNWVGVDGLSRELGCAVCGVNISAPVDRPWQFRLNEFVQRAVRDHGVGALLWALRVLQDDARGEPMYFLGPTALYYSSQEFDSRRIDAELDLLVVLGTSVALVEAKTSVREFHPEQTIGPARRIRPNRVVIAIMENRFAAADSRVQAVRDGLQDLPITVDLIMLNEWPLSDDPWLPGVRGRATFRIRLM